MTKLLLMLICALSLSAQAQGWGRPGGPGHGGGGDHGGGPGHGGDRPGDRGDLHAYLNQSIRGQGSIDLNYELRLDNYRGQRIQDIILVASARQDRRDRWRRGSQADAVIRVDNRTMGYPQRLDDRTQSISFARDMGSLEIGRNCGRLSIDIRGDDVFVSEVIVRLDDRGGPGDRDTVMQTINHDVRRGDDMNLNYILRLEPRQADNATEIIVRARGLMRDSSVQAVVDNDVGQVQYLTSDTREIRLTLPQGRRDQRMTPNIRLIVRGDAYIEAVGVRMGRF